MLEMDDKKILQSISICRFLANKVGLAGSNELENLEIDAVVDTISDIRTRESNKLNKNTKKIIKKYNFTEITLAMWEQDAEIKEKKLKLLRDELLPLYFGKLEEYAAANDGHLSCKKLTWADLFLASFTVYFAHGLKDDFQDFKGYPNLQKVVENVMAIENIKKYVDERPATFC